MALFAKIIEWKDASPNTLAYKVPVESSQINNKSRLIVRPSQMAIFVHKGKIADIFAEGSYDLNTEILPILSKLAGIKFGFKTPITVDIFYINTKQFTNIKWGTANPIPLRDPELGIVRVRGFGSYAFKIDAPDAFLLQILGTKPFYSVGEISEYLTSIIVSGITDAIGEAKVSVFDLAGNTFELQEITTKSLQAKFKDLGLLLTSFNIENMSVPKSVEEAIDKRSSLGAMSDKTDVYMKLAAADAMKDAAKNPGMTGGMMGAGLGMGAGIGMGQMFSDAFKGVSQPSQPTSSGAHCPKCGASIAVNAKFCGECGAKIKQVGKFCPNCGKPVSGKFCGECGAKVE